MTLRSSAGGLLAGRNETLRERLPDKSSECFSVTGCYGHAHGCVSAVRARVPGRGWSCPSLQLELVWQLGIHASRDWDSWALGKCKV